MDSVCQYHADKISKILLKYQSIHCSNVKHKVEHETNLHYFHPLSLRSVITDPHLFISFGPIIVTP